MQRFDMFTKPQIGHIIDTLESHCLWSPPHARLIALCLATSNLCQAQRTQLEAIKKSKANPNDTMPQFIDININVGSGRGGSSNINISSSSYSSSNSSYNSLLDDFDDLGFYDDFERSRLGSRVPLREERDRDGIYRMVDRAGRTPYQSPGRGDSYGSSRLHDLSPPPMLRSRGYGEPASNSRRGSEFETWGVRPEGATSGRYDRRGRDGPSYRVEEVRPLQANDSRSYSTIRPDNYGSRAGGERRDSRADFGSRYGSELQERDSRAGSQRRDSRAESYSRSGYGSGGRGSRSDERAGDSSANSRLRYGFDFDGRDSLRGSQRDSSSTVRPERAAPSTSSRHQSRHESRRADSTSSSRSDARGFRTETVRPEWANGSSPRSGSRHESRAGSSSSSRGFRTEEVRPESARGSSKSSSRHESRYESSRGSSRSSRRYEPCSSTHYGASSSTSFGQPKARLSLPELKTLFDQYTANWDATTRTSPTFPFPAQSRDLYNISFLTSSAPRDTTISAEDVYALNVQTILLGGFGISAYATVRSEKPCLGLGSSIKKEDLDVVLKYLKRKEQPRWHPDWMSLRTGMQGSVDEGISKRKEVVAMRVAVQRLIEFLESRIV